MKKMMVLLGAFALIGLGFLIGSKKDLGLVDLSFNVKAASPMDMIELSDNQWMDLDDETNQLTLFLDLQNELINQHHILVAKHEELKELREEFKTIRSQFRSENRRLSREDGLNMLNSYYDLMDLKEAYEQTYGLAYQRLETLKGMYQIEHYDLIMQTYQEVLDVLIYRETLVNQAIHLFNEGIIIYQNHIE